MTAKEYLKQIQKADVMINQRIKEKDDPRTMSTSIGSFDYSKERVQTSPLSGARYENQVDKMADLEAEINRLIDDYVDLKHKLITQIQGLREVKLVDILYKRYVEDKNLEEIAAEMNFTYQYVRELHGRALQEFERTYTNLH